MNGLAACWSSPQLIPVERGDRYAAYTGSLPDVTRPLSDAKHYQVRAVRLAIEESKK